MSTLYLVRHGQASFGAADYDVLSDVGAVQAHHLGAAWAERGVHLDAVYTGPRKRHADTTEHMMTGAREHGVDYPSTEYLDDLDEYPAFKLLSHWMPVLSAEDPEFQALMSGGKGHENNAGPGKGPRFERAFRFIMDRWASGELDRDSLETFAHFRERVCRGLRHIMDVQGRGKTIAVITSGGPICMALQMALSLDDHIAIQQGWVIVNGSVSEFRYRDSSALTLVRFNLCDHLRDLSLLTYR